MRRYGTLIFREIVSTVLTKGSGALVHGSSGKEPDHGTGVSPARIAQARTPYILR